MFSPKELRHCYFLLLLCTFRYNSIHMWTWNGSAGRIPRPDVPACSKHTLLAGTSGAVCQPARPWSFRAAQIYAVRKTRSFQNDADFTNSLLGKESNRWHSQLVWRILGFQLQNFFQIRPKQPTTWCRVFLDRAITNKPVKNSPPFLKTQGPIPCSETPPLDTILRQNIFYTLHRQYSRSILILSLHVV